jgi:hypothetical protein
MVDDMLTINFEHKWYYVYLIRELGNDGFYKIGITNNLTQRMSTLQTGNPRKLEYVDTVKCFDKAEAYLYEQFLHGCLQQCRAGGEWFMDSSDVDVIGVFNQMKQQVQR